MSAGAQGKVNRGAGCQGDRRGQALTCGLEDTRVALAVPLGKGLHHPVNLLCLPWQPEAPQELPVVSEFGADLGAPRFHSHTQPSQPPTTPKGHAQLPAPYSPQGLHKVEVCEFMQLHKGMQDLDVELIPVGTKPEHEGCMISNPVTAEWLPCPCPAADSTHSWRKAAATLCLIPGLVCTNQLLASASHDLSTPSTPSTPSQLPCELRAAVSLLSGGRSPEHPQETRAQCTSRPGSRRWLSC